MEAFYSIDSLIPQKHPFVMVDALIDYNETCAISNFTIKQNNMFVKGHFFSESGIIENMAQTTALHTGYSYMLKGEKAPTGYLGSIKNIQIKSLPRVNETIKTEINILHEFLGVTLVEVKVYDRGNTIVAQGQMKTVIAGE